MKMTFEEKKRECVNWAIGEYRSRWNDRYKTDQILSGRERYMFAKIVSRCLVNKKTIGLVLDRFFADDRPSIRQHSVAWLSRALVIYQNGWTDYDKTSKIETDRDETEDEKTFARRFDATMARE